MKFLNIVKSGISNVVDENTFKSIYEPAGWKVVGDHELKVETIKSPADETVKKNVNRMKRTAAKKFDDRLIKGEDDVEI